MKRLEREKILDRFEELAKELDSLTERPGWGILHNSDCPTVLCYKGDVVHEMETQPMAMALVEMEGHVQWWRDFKAQKERMQTFFESRGIKCLSR